MSRTVLESSCCDNQKTEILVPTSVRPESPYSFYHTCVFFTDAEASLQEQRQAIKGNEPLFDGNNFKKIECDKNNNIGLSNGM